MSSDNVKLSIEEIARQFELPERKSKLASMFGQERPINCVCKSTSSSIFVVTCNFCGNTFHGSCVGVAEAAFKRNNEQNFQCQTCKNENRTSSPSSQESGQKRSCKAKVGKGSYEQDPSYTPSLRKGKNSSCEKCVNCLRTKNCGTCKPCKNRKKKYAKKRKCINRICCSENSTENSNPDETKQNITTESVGEKENLHRQDDKKGVQCYGPGCTESARQQSKYCSDECGLKLATNRIMTILPQRLEDWKIRTPAGEKYDRQKLDEIREKQVTVREKIKNLNCAYKDLESLIEKGKSLSPIEMDLEKNKKTKGKGAHSFCDPDDESSVYCVTCGREIHTSSAVKHMKKCFMKHESFSTFGSIHETKIEGRNMFCDFLNPTRRYCKRLKSLCPEHDKWTEGREDEACGCPLRTGDEELCRNPKKYCSQHWWWERSRRAELDLELTRQWLRLDELVRREGELRASLGRRAGLLPLLLHSTYDHEEAEAWSPAREEARQRLVAQLVKQAYGSSLSRHRKSASTTSSAQPKHLTHL